MQKLDLRAKLYMFGCCGRLSYMPININSRWLLIEDRIFAVVALKAVSVLFQLAGRHVEGRQNRPIDLFDPKLKDQLDNIEKLAVSTFAILHFLCVLTFPWLT